MLWRAWSLYRHVQRIRTGLVCPGRHARFTTRPTFQTGVSNGSFTCAKPTVRSSARTQVQAPFFRAAQLFRDTEKVPNRAKKAEIKISGIVRSIRKQKHASFAHISDGTTFAPIQVVLGPELAAGYVTIV